MAKGIRIRIEINGFESKVEVRKMSETNLSNIDLIIRHKELIAQLLEVETDRFSNHGCNDFALTDYLPDWGDRHDLARTVFDEGDRDRYDTENEYEEMNDYELMSFFADKIRKLSADIG